MIEVSDLIIIAFFSGIGTVIGQAFGKWIYEKTTEHGSKLLTTKKAKELNEALRKYLDTEE